MGCKIVTKLAVITNANEKLSLDVTEKDHPIGHIVERSLFGSYLGEKVLDGSRRPLVAEKNVAECVEV